MELKSIEELKNERDEAIYRNKASEEKLLALQKMQNDQELLEKNLGYFPLKNGYQQNMERTLDSIMQKNENEYYNNNINNKNNLKENKDEPITTAGEACKFSLLKINCKYAIPSLAAKNIIP